MPKKVYNTKDLLDYSDKISPDETPDRGVLIHQKKNRVTIEDDIQEFNIHELDLNDISPKGVDDPDGAKYITIGKPRTGKSVLIKAFIYSKKHIIPVGQFYSGTEDSNHTFSGFAPSLFVDTTLGNYASSWDDYHKRQKICMQYIPENPWNLRVEDDCSSDTKIFNKETYHDVFKNDRHRKSVFFLSLQYAMDIKPVIRTCLDGTFIMRETGPKARKTLLENYVPILKSMHEFDAVMDAICTDFTSLFINNKTQSSNIEEILYYYKADKKKADMLDKIKFGCDEYWHFAQQRVADGV